MQSVGAELMTYAPQTIWDELLTAQEVADLVDVHVKTYQRWVRMGKGPRITVLNGVDRFAMSDVRTWIESRKTVPVGNNEEQ